MLSKSQLEAWVHKILDLVEAKKKIEDDRVELKREFLADANKAARRIAACANASRDDMSLWIIGVDEDEGVIGANDVEFSTWWPKVISQFNGVAPDIIHHLSIPRGDLKYVVAILLDPTRPPYVIRNPDFGVSKTAIEFEVPLRQGTKTKSARREDLLAMLAPYEALPECEVLHAVAGEGIDRGVPTFSVNVHLYITARPGQAIIMRRHKCRAHVSVLGEDVCVPLEVEQIGAPGSGGRTTNENVVESKNETIITRAGMIYVRAEMRASVGRMAGHEINVALDLDVAFAAKQIQIRVLLKPTARSDGRDPPAWIIAK